MKIETVFNFLWRILFGFYDYERENGDNHVSKTETTTLFCFEKFSKLIEEKNQSLLFNEEKCLQEYKIKCFFFSFCFPNETVIKV